MGDAISPFSLSQERRVLRAALRARRRALTAHQREVAARRVAAHVAREFHLYPRQRVALYSPLPDELDTRPLFELAALHRCEIYLPRLLDYRARRMRFHPASDEMRPNRLGILEPDALRFIGARWLDLVFVPLVGFDSTGMRLGMGAGYYDRAFAYRRWRQTWRRPRLIGIAYSFQQVDHIAAAAHDVRLDAIVTEAGVLQCRTG